MRSVEVAKRADQKLILIPVVFILVHIWGTIRFFRFLACLPDCQYTGPSHALPVLIILQVTVGSFYLVKRLNYTQGSVQCMIQCRGGSRGRVQHPPPPPTPWDDLQFSNTTGVHVGSPVSYAIPQWCTPPKKNPGSAPAVELVYSEISWSSQICCLLPAIPSRASEWYSWF